MKILIFVIFVLCLLKANALLAEYNEDAWTDISSDYRNFEKSAVIWVKYNMRIPRDFGNFPNPQNCKNQMQKNENGMFFKICFVADKPDENPQPGTAGHSRMWIYYIVKNYGNSWKLIDKLQEAIA